MSNTQKVRTTFQPDVEVEVGAAELVDLTRQGLVVQEAKVSAKNTPTRNGKTLIEEDK